MDAHVGEVVNRVSDNGRVGVVLARPREEEYCY